MEIFPHGTIHVSIPSRNDHYTWKKVTTCIHGIMSGEKWADHYGEMVISNPAHNIECRLNFVKAGYFGPPKNEVVGKVINTRENVVVCELFGTWHEYLTCKKPGQADKTVWTVNPRPSTTEQYYGLTPFAISLNEIREGETYPPTDTRWRPDQRFLENGDLDKAEAEKLRIENLQREMRKERERTGQHWAPRFFKLESGSSSEETEDVDEKLDWIFNGTYWDMKFNNPPKLW